MVIEYVNQCADRGRDVESEIADAIEMRDWWLKKIAECGIADGVLCDLFGNPVTPIYPGLEFDEP